MAASQLNTTQILNLHSILVELLNEISLKTASSTSYYLVDINSYRKLIYNGLHEKLSIDIQPYYKKSTNFYVNREMTWHSFIIILKHICKVLGLKIIQYSTRVFHIYTQPAASSPTPTPHIA